MGSRKIRSSGPSCFAQNARRLVPLIMLILYSVIGAFVFNLLESGHEMENRKILNKNLTEIRNRVVDRVKLIHHSYPEGPLRDRWISVELVRMQEALGVKADQGPPKWTWLGSLYYAMTLYTTIGYGNFFPATFLGRVVTLVYALIGIPLALITMVKFGAFLTSCLICIWGRLRACCLRSKRLRHQIEDDHRLINEEENLKLLAEQDNLDILTLPTSFIVFSVILWVAFCAALFCLIENWEYFSSFYFTVITFTTIGLGDIVPHHRKATVILCFVFALIGISLLSALFALIQHQLESLFDLLDMMLEREYLAGQLGGDAALPMSEDDGEVDAEINRMLKKLPCSARVLYWASSDNRKRSLKKNWNNRARYRPKATQTDEALWFGARRLDHQKEQETSACNRSHDDVESLVELCGYNMRGKKL